MGAVVYYAVPKLFNLIDISNRFSYYRTFRIITTLSITLVIYIAFNTRTLPSKHFHELITQPEPNGKYVRTTLKVTI